MAAKGTVVCEKGAKAGARGSCVRSVVEGEREFSGNSGATKVQDEKMGP